MQLCIINRGDYFEHKKKMFNHGEPEKKIWYIVLFQKKYVEKDTTISKSHKENFFS